MNAPATGEIEGWRNVAAGWERRRAFFSKATSELSERMVELLAPEPGETILELAAGPGETGFLAVPHLLPGGHLISTDVASEMVDAARRRSAELGFDHVSFSVEDATQLTLADASVDGVLCRFGLMLVPDMGAMAREIARVVRPGGRAVLAVWASPQRNPWMTAVGKAALELGLTDPPPEDAPGPFRLADPERLRHVVEGSGLEIDVLEEATVNWQAASLDEWWEATGDMSPSMELLLERLTVTEVAALREAAESRLAEFVEPGGSVAVPGVAQVLRARRTAA